MPAAVDIGWVVVGGEVVVGALGEAVDGVEPAVQVHRPQACWQKPSGTLGAAPEMASHCPKLFCSSQAAIVQ